MNNLKSAERGTKEQQAAHSGAPEREQGMTRFIITEKMWAEVEEADLSDRGFSRLLHVVLDDAFCGVDGSQELQAAASALFFDLRAGTAAAEADDLAARAEDGTGSSEACRFIFTPAMWEMLQRAKLPDGRFRAVVAAVADSVFAGEDQTAALGQNLGTVARTLRKRSLEAAGQTAHVVAPERGPGMTRYIFTRDMWAGVKEAELSDRGFRRLLHAILDDAFCGVDRSQELPAAASALFFDLRLDAAAVEAHLLAARDEDRAESSEDRRFIFTPAMWEILQRAQLPDRKLRAVVAAVAGSIFSGEDRTAGLGRNIRAVARALRKRSLEAGGAQHRRQDELAEAYRARRLLDAAAQNSAREARHDADDVRETSVA